MARGGFNGYAVIPPTPYGAPVGERAECSPRELPKTTQEAPKRPPRGPQEAPKRSPRDIRHAPETFLRTARAYPTTSHKILPRRHKMTPTLPRCFQDLLQMGQGYAFGCRVSFGPHPLFSSLSSLLPGFPGAPPRLHPWTLVLHALRQSVPFQTLPTLQILASSFQAAVVHDGGSKGLATRLDLHGGGGVARPAGVLDPPPPWFTTGAGRA